MRCIHKIFEYSPFLVTFDFDLWPLLLNLNYGKPAWHIRLCKFEVISFKGYCLITQIHKTSCFTRTTTVFSNNVWWTRPILVNMHRWVTYYANIVFSLTGCSRWTTSSEQPDKRRLLSSLQVSLARTLMSKHQWHYYYYLRRRRRLCFRCGLFVCLSVRRITRKLVYGFWRNFLEG